LGFPGAALFLLSGQFHIAALIRRLVDYRYTLIDKRCKNFLPKNDNFFSMTDKEVRKVTRKILPGPLIVATHNPGKLKEISDLLRPFGIEPVSAGAAGLIEPQETEKTFAGNAALKARAASLASGMTSLADDSGLEVDALGGAPGVLSARWAGPGKDFRHAMARVEAELAERPGSDFSARFICALAAGWPDGVVQIFEGAVEGHLSFPPRGDRGFGYDPIFVPRGFSQTFGEMEPQMKHAMSHRAAAFRKFVESCF
jgi:XTP/dITP diphosphohydrolase